MTREPTWLKGVVIVLAIVGLVALANMFTRQNVYLDYNGGAELVEKKWWGLQSKSYPLRVISADLYGEVAPHWYVRDDSGKWVPVQIEPDDVDY